MSDSDSTTVPAHVDDEDPRGPDFGKPHNLVQTCADCGKALRHESTHDPKELTWTNPPFVPASTANYTSGRGGYKVHGAIIHTVVGSKASAVSAFQNPARGASAHLIMGEDGTEVQMVDTDNTAWHCGRYFPDAAHPLANVTTVGIEHEDGGAYNAPRTDALYKIAGKRLAMVASIHGFPLDRAHVKMHREVSVLATSCPDTLDINRIIAEAIKENTPVPVDTRPEWLRNLTKLSTAINFTLGKVIPIIGLVAPYPQVGSAAPGPLTVTHQTTVAGVAYWTTFYGSTHGNGLRKSDVAGAIVIPTPVPPAPVPVPPAPTPSPVPPAPPTPPPSPSPGPQPQPQLSLFQKFIAFIKGLLRLR